MLKAIITGDWHFEKLCRFFPYGADIDIHSRVIDSMCVYAVENCIKHVIIPGDLTHKPSMGDEYMTALIYVLAKYKNLLTFHYIPGNHDFKERGKCSSDVLEALNKCSLLPHFTIYKQVTDVVIDGTRVVFVPYPNTTYEKGDPALVIGHVEQVGATGDNGLPLRKVSDNHTIALHEGDMLVSGHLHTHQYIKKRRTLFPGAPYQTTFGEQGPKGFVHLRAAPGETSLKTSWEFVHTPRLFKLINLVVNTDSDWAKIKKSDRIFYKVTKAAGITTPKDLTREYPNVMSVTGEFDRTALAETLKADIVVDAITPTTGLTEFMRKSGLTRDERRLAKEIVTDIINELV